MPGGFRHNVNSVRVLERIERHKGRPGLNPRVLHQIGDQRGNALAVAVPQHFSELSRQIFLPQHTAGFYV